MLFRELALLLLGATCVLTDNVSPTDTPRKYFIGIRSAVQEDDPYIIEPNVQSLRGFISTYIRGNTYDQERFKTDLLRSIDYFNDEDNGCQTFEQLAYLIVSCVFMLDGLENDVCEFLEGVMAQARERLAENNCEMVSFMKRICGKKLEDCWMLIGEGMTSPSIGVLIASACRRFNCQSSQETSAWVQKYYLKMAELCKKTFFEGRDSEPGEWECHSKFYNYYYLLTRRNLYEYLKAFDRAELKSLQSTFYYDKRDREVLFSLYLQSRFGENESKVIREFCIMADRQFRVFEPIHGSGRSFPQFSRISEELQIYIFSLTDVVTQIFTFPRISKQLSLAHNTLLISSPKLQRSFGSYVPQDVAVFECLPWRAIFKDSRDMLRYFIQVVQDGPINCLSLFYEYSNRFLSTYCQDIGLMNVPEAEARESYTRAFIDLTIAEERGEFHECEFSSNLERLIKFRPPEWMSTMDYVQSIEILVFNYAIIPTLPDKFDSIVELWKLFGEGRKTLLEKITLNNPVFPSLLEHTCANSLLDGCEFPEALVQFVSTRSALMKEIKERNLALPLNDYSIMANTDLFGKVLDLSTGIHEKKGIEKLVKLLRENREDRETVHKLANSVPGSNILFDMLDYWHLFTEDTFQEIADILLASEVIDKDFIEHLPSLYEDSYNSSTRSAQPARILQQTDESSEAHSTGLRAH